jgi:dienelactone hydrolase
VTLWFIPTPLLAAEPLPNTKPLTDEGNLATKMVAGMHKYLDRELAASVEKRQTFWKPDLSSAANYDKSTAPNRERLRKLLGVVDPRLPPHLEYVGGPDSPALVAEADRYKVYAVRWAVLPGIDGEGLLLEPRAKAIANVVALPDADATPEEMVGLDGDALVDAQFARRMAENGCRVIVPVLINRKDDFSANPKLGRATNQPHREFIHRMAFEMGRTLIGYEVQKVLAAVDWFCSQKDHAPVGVAGRGEGGVIALHAAALDERIAASAVSGVFGTPGTLAEQPIYRNVWSSLTEFGDADILRLVFPRPIVVEVVGFSAPGPVVKPGRAGAAPGQVSTGGILAVTSEVERVLRPLAAASFPRLKSGFIGGGEVGRQNSWDQRVGPVMAPTHSDFLSNLQGRDEGFQLKPEQDPPSNLRKNFDPVARQKRQFDQLVSYTQKLWRDSEATRKAYWAKADASSPAAWEKSCEAYREYFHSEVIGKLPEPTIPLNPRTRQVYDEKTWTGHEVMLDVYPDVFAYGILLLPKDLKPGERRPVVVCQHGLEGTPRHTIDPEKNPVYDQFSRRLVEQGYIVYAPQNPYYGENTFRQLQRKANPLKLSLFSFIIRQHQRTIDWLETLPNVDPKRIGFYGLSYGGKTAMRVPVVEKRYCLSICAGDFNEWIGKNVSVDLDRSYMWTREYEMYEFDLGNTFNYAEMAYLIAPRPFMVERGHDDGVGTDEMVSYEYAKVRYLYANRLKIADRTEIEYLPGGHRIFGKGTYAFLSKHLHWPEK